MPTSTKLQRFHYYQGKIKYKVWLQFFLLTLKKHNHEKNPNNQIAFSTQSLSKSPIKNHATLFGSDQVIKPDQTKLGSIKPNKSPIWRLVQPPTSTAILQSTISHPYNSSSYPQGRRPIEAAHNFNFSIVTPLINMSAGAQIFSSITNLSSTR